MIKLHQRHNVVSLARGDFDVSISQSTTGHRYVDLYHAFALCLLSITAVTPAHRAHRSKIETLIGDTFDRVCLDHQLTIGERVQLIALVLADYAKHNIRVERHGAR